MSWKLKRLKQCDKCPWKVSTDPYDIPDGYDVEKHRALAITIGEPGTFGWSGHVMACHEHNVGEETHCIGWLAHQLGRGNNIPLRLAMRNCDNIGLIKLDGEQHESFEDTLP